MGGIRKGSSFLRFKVACNCILLYGNLYGKNERCEK